MPFDQLPAIVTENRNMGGAYYVLTLAYDAPDGLAPTMPGHFAMLRHNRDLSIRVFPSCVTQIECELERRMVRVIIEIQR